MSEPIEVIQTEGANDYTISGLTFSDIEIIEEGIIRLFNESSKSEHRDFRSQVLRLDRGIGPVIWEKEIKKQQFQKP